MATAKHVMLVSGPLRILAVHLLPSRSLINSYMSASLGGGVPVLMVLDFDTKHVDRYSRLITRSRILHYYASENSCSIYRPGT